ncbi:putative D-arabinitol dehydrogenase (NADP(+)) [Seiridium unicorne]|uniref:D-arabinitol dehydrogenase (NADP(+)) n=1 Tax=Seiridium unicorne TaxID=138068 RepID=A0ABR2UJ52_9PEZI
MASDPPAKMKAIQYNKPLDFDVVKISVPEPEANEVLVRAHFADGYFPSAMPLVTGHEMSGEVAKIGKSVKGLSIGDKVTADSLVSCGCCNACRRGRSLYCDNIRARGMHSTYLKPLLPCPIRASTEKVDGGFAEYCVFPASKLTPIPSLSWTQATLIEAAACAIHGLDRIKPAYGSSVLLLGAGPTGLCLSQLFRAGGCVKVVLAANAGTKLDLARQDPEPDWKSLQDAHPAGFDIVIEATGDIEVLRRSIDYCAKGGTLGLYGVYPPAETLTISPFLVFFKELSIIASCSQLNCVPRAVDYIKSGRLRVDGIVTHTFSLEEYGEAIRSVQEKKCVKAAILID